MKKALLLVLTVLVLTIGIFIAIVAMQPDELTITRAATYDASPEEVFSQINNFHNWNTWSPWATIDPQMNTTFSGPASGVGSEYAWTGNSEVGEGRMTIIESRPNQSVKIDLEFLKPFPTKNLVDFTLKPEGEKTTLVWTMSTKNGFIGKAFCLVVDMDKMLGNDFEKRSCPAKTDRRIGSLIVEGG